MGGFLDRKRIWWGLGAIGVVTAVLLLIAPEEATLGAGIRSVYVHVALIWVGLAGFVVAGLLGMIAGSSLTGLPRNLPDL